MVIRGDPMSKCQGGSIVNEIGLVCQNKNLTGAAHARQNFRGMGIREPLSPWGFFRRRLLGNDRFPGGKPNVL
jgi:hypothetical protein